MNAIKPSWIGIVLVGCIAMSSAEARTLTFEDRVAAQRAIERVYWAQRIWPPENPTPKSRIDWQPEQGPASWNVYVGSLDVLVASGVYTQVPGSDPLGARYCGVTDLFVDYATVPASGKVSYSLVTGVTAGIEGDLGADGAGNTRPNDNPCP